MDRIFIPTIYRPNDQITFQGLPKSLQEKTTLVVQEWEYERYSLDCDYLVLPKHINTEDYLCLTKTRDFIHQQGRNQKYVMVDDDMVIKRRNSKYTTGISDMEKSNRVATDDDILEMFELFSGWLDQPDVAVCGPSLIETPPGRKPFRSNASVTSMVFCNGSKLSSVIDELPTKHVRYGEDVLFILSLLSRGFGNRVSEIFCIENHSLKGKLPDTVWKDTEYQNVWRDHKIIEDMFPEFFKILLDDDGNRVEGGFRNFGKTRISYSKCYKRSQESVNQDDRQKKPIKRVQVESNNYVIPTGKRVTISEDLENEIRSRFDNDRENKFQLFLLSNGIRQKYLKRDGTYSKTFLEWYTSSGMKDLFGSLPNFTKYASCGEVISYVGTQTSDPDKYLKQLPLSVGSLYEISMILKQDENLFRMCLHYTPKRKSVEEPQYEWKTSRPALIRKNVTEQNVRTWRRKFNNPPPPRVKRTDKRTLPFVEITCSGELFDFDKKTGDKVGNLDLDEVEHFFEKLTEFVEKESPNDLQFKLSDSMDYLTEGYYKRKELVDPSRNVKTEKKGTRYK